MAESTACWGEAAVSFCVRVTKLKLVHRRLLVLDAVALSDCPSLAVSRNEPVLVQVCSPSLMEDCRQICGEAFLKADQNGKATSMSTGRWLQLQQHKLCLMLQTSPLKARERNRKGTKLVECDHLCKVTSESSMSTSSLQLPSAVSAKTERHDIFAEWLVQTYGVSFLSSGTGVLDVAGGKGHLSRSLIGLGVRSTIILDPNPRCGDTTKDIPDGQVMHVIAKAIYDDGTHLLQENNNEATLIQNCSIIVGLHPDQATEPIVDLAQHLQVPFATLPCCVMPSLFPSRRQKRHGDPVRSYSSFCQYLLDKAPDGVHYKQTYLPFAGRNRVIFHSS